MIVSAEALAGIALIELGLVIIPGPNMIYLVSRSVAQGRKAGLISLAGVGVGFGVYMLAAAAGLATLFALVPEIYVTLKLAGAAYLLWLAWNALRPGGGSVFTPNELAPDRPRKLFGMGLLTCILNPKIAILYISLLPQFVDPSRGHIGLQSLVLGFTQLAVGVAVNGLFVITAGSVAIFFTRRPVWMRVHRYLTGTALAAFAIRIATDRARPLPTH
ncbi:threonine/homoserine/homoserine lactone efflux protein [Kribbella sp. VKM Ac-2527]|uniref:Threonine/homoserine/homoserine lactone efflux protein n=1 Tax=Kribbella caucasensis TaxID=2512215 RepID=A0A4R6K7M7_9ACTN|nr:LysE family translocator [Kribbella sp. VKM Ac-2527]TDO45003.1 threonine/homoserine/homoserine lactone efflux protein [Kribbella sp. VKM Ac-2527]